MIDATPIPKEVLAAAHRKMCRLIGAEILRCMGDTDTSFALMAVRLGTTEKIVRGWMDQFMDGTAQSLALISDMCCAMGAEMEFKIRPKPTLEPIPQ